MDEITGFPEFVTKLPEAALPFAGGNAWLIQGESSQVVFLKVDEALEVPEHAHQDQWEIVLGGSVVLCIGGKAQEYRAGDHFFIPAGVAHSAEVRAGYRAVIIFNEPGRYQAIDPG